MKDIDYSDIRQIKRTIDFLRARMDKIRHKKRLTEDDRKELEIIGASIAVEQNKIRNILLRQTSVQDAPAPDYDKSSPS